MILRPADDATAARRPTLVLRTLDRGDGLLGLLPCGPVRPPARTPLFGARGPQVTVAWLDWPGPAADPAARGRADARLAAAGLHPLPAEALQWRGGAGDLPDRALWSLVREADFGAFWAEALPALRAEGWAVDLRPGFAHAAQPVAGWQLAVEPLQGPRGVAGWTLSLGLQVHTAEGLETLDLVPLLARLLRQDRRWTDAQALDALPDDTPVRLLAPGGRVIDTVAAPLKPLARTLVDLLLRPRPRGDAAGLRLDAHDTARLAALRDGLASARAGTGAGDWRLRGDALQAWLALREAAPPPVAPPAGLGLALRAYQLAGVAWLQRLARLGGGALLADDMGLGKTAQLLAHLLLEREAGRLDRPALVVAPASLLDHWRAEAARVAPALRVLLLQGPRRADALARLAAHDLVLTSYPLLWRDAMALQRQPWHLVALDEAQWVKNAGSRSAAAARRLDARHRVALTGTPLENHLGELWTQFQFLLPGWLGDARSFQRDWRTPIERQGNGLRARLLAQRLAPFVLRRRRAEVAAELPPLTEQLQRVSLDGAQRTLYEGLRLAADRQVRRLLAARGLDAALPGVLESLLQLRQACNDPRLLAPPAAVGPAPPGHSAKLDWLRATLPALVAAGRRVLVFSQFTRMLALVEAELAALGLPWLALTGDTPVAERAGRVAAFQRGDAPLLLASLRAGGVGLTLTAADTVVLVDPWWNPAVEAQAAARAHRLGQTRPVHVYRLVAAGSIEERLLALQQRKAALAEALLGGAGDGPATALDADTVHALLAPLDPPGGAAAGYN